MDQKMAMHNNMPIQEDKEETELYGIWQKKSLSEAPNLNHSSQLIYKTGTAQAVVDSCAAVLSSHSEGSLGRRVPSHHLQTVASANQSLMDFLWDYSQEDTEHKGRMGRRYLINYTLPHYTNAQSLSNKQEEMKLGVNEH